MLIGTQYNSCSAWNVDLKVIWSLVMLIRVSLEPYVVSTIKSLESSKTLLIRFIENEMVRFPIRSNCVIFVGLRMMEIEDINQVTFFINYEFVAFIVYRYILVRLHH